MVRRLLLSLLLAFPGTGLLPAGGAAQDFARPGEILLEVLRGRDAGLVDSLATAWETAVRRDPSDRLPVLGLAGLARVTSRYARADSLLERLGALDLAMPAAGQAPPDPVALWAAAELAEALRLRGRFREADPLFRVADAWAVELQVPSLEGRTALGRATWYSRAGPRDSVAVHLERIQALGTRADPWIRAILRCQGVIGLPGAASEVRERVEEAAAAAEADGFPHLAADCQATLHRRYAAEGNADSALAVMARMEGLSRRSGDPITLAALLERRAVLLYNIGALGRATVDAHEAVEVGERGGNLSAGAWALLHLALIHRAVGDLDTALQALDRAADLFELQGDRSGALVARRRRAQVEAAAGRHGEAFRALEALQLEIGAALGATDGAFVALDLLDVAVAARDHLRADSLLPVVREALVATGNGGWVPGLAWRETAVSLGMGDLERARRSVERDLQGVEVPSQRYLGLVDLARVRLAGGDAAGAADALEDGLAELERWRAGLPVEQLRRSAFALTRGFSEGTEGPASVVAALAAAGQVERALALAERQRARGLLENVLRSDALTLAGEPASAELLGRVSEPLTAAGIRRALPATTAGVLVVTGVDGEPSTAFVLTRDTTVAVPLPPADRLEPALDRFVSGLRAGTWLEGPADELGQAVAEPLMAALHPAITTVVWVPDGPLHALPLDALPLRDGGRVLDRLAVARVPSLSVMVALLGRSPVGGGRVVAFADPGGTAEVPLAMRAAFDLEALPALPGAVREASRVARRGRPGELLRGGEATEQAVRGLAAAPVGTIHLATHAIVDPDSPARTALVLAAGGGEDGLLTPGELARLGIRADLVVLSACSTAGGTTLRGEGVQGLVAPLLGGGVRVAVATGWDIPDRMPAPLMEAFYEELAAGTPVAEALRRAKRAALEAGASPATWAAFQVIGDPGVVAEVAPTPLLRPRGVTAGLMLAAGAVLLLLVYRGRRKPGPT